MTTTKELTTRIVQRMKDLHVEIARTWKVPPDVITEVIVGATFGLGVTMMFESGYDEDQIVEIVRRLVGDLSAPAGDRGAS